MANRDYRLPNSIIIDTVKSSGNTLTIKTGLAPNLTLSQIGGPSYAIEMDSDGYRILAHDDAGNTTFGSPSSAINITGATVVQTTTGYSQVYAGGILAFSTDGSSTVLGDNTNGQTFLRAGSSVVIQPLNTTTFARFTVSGTTITYIGEPGSPGTSLSFLGGNGLTGNDNGGSIALDAGSKQGAGLNGIIDFGSINARTINVGNGTSTLNFTSGSGMNFSGGSKTFAGSTYFTVNDAIIQLGTTGGELIEVNGKVSTNVTFYGTANPYVIAVGTSPGANETGGNLTIRGGQGGATNSNGGNIYVDSGAKAGTGTNGSVDIGGTNSTNVYIGRSGQETYVRGFFAPFTSGGTLGLTSNPWGAAWINGPISTVANDDLQIKSNKTNTSSAKNVYINTLELFTGTAKIFELQNNNAATLSFDGYGNLIFNTVAFPVERSISVSSPGVNSDGYALSILSGPAGTDTGPGGGKGGNIQLLTGVGTGSNAGGNLLINTSQGGTNSGDAGDINILPGAGRSGSGAINGSYAGDINIGSINMSGGASGGSSSLARNGGYVNIASGVGGDGSGTQPGASGGYVTVSAGYGGAGTTSAVAASGGVIDMLSGRGGTNNGGGGGIGGYIRLQSGQGADAYGSSPGTASGNLNFNPSTGGAGSATGAAGEGGSIFLTGGQAGANNGGGGNNGGGIYVDAGTATGAGTAGIISLGVTNASAITIGRAGIISTVQGSLRVNGNTQLYGNTELGDTSADLIYFTGVVTTSISGNQNFGFISQTQAGADTASNQFTVSSGYGGNASVTAGGAGGTFNLGSGFGGNGTGGLAPGRGGHINVRAGDAGTGGTGNANGGDATLDAGNKSGTGTEGVLSLGASYASAVNISRGGKLTSIDGYLKVDGYARLSHDVGFTDTLALTQPANTTTGANLRLRKLRFFADNDGVSQVTAPEVYAADGSRLVLKGIDVFIDSSTLDWAQNASIYTGGFSLQLGPVDNHLKINPGVTNTLPAFDFVAVGTGASVGDNIASKLTFTATETDNNVNNIGNKIRVLDNSNDGYTGTVTGLYVDAEAGTNTSKTKYSANLIGDVLLDGYYGGRIRYTATGIDVPTFTTRSIGSKIIFSSQVDATHVDTAIGLEGGALWMSVPQATNVFSYKWYGGITPVMRLDANGVLFLGAANASTPSPTINLGGTTSSLINWGTSGAGPPTVTTRSVGTKAVLYDTLSGAGVDAGFGVETSYLWSSVANNTLGFKWYAGTTEIMRLEGSGQLQVDGYLRVDGYGYLSHDIGFADTLRLTESTNTTTGATLRLRTLKFFDDGSPTSALNHKIYAPDGNTIGVSATRWQFGVTDIDSSSQDILWNTGGNNLKISNVSSSLLINDSLGSGNSAGLDGYALISGGDATTRHGMRMAVESNTTAGSNGVTIDVLNLTMTDSTSITGTLIGLNVDMTGGSNTTKQRIGAKYSMSSIGTTQNPGVILKNITAATDGYQQYSPMLELDGYGWKTTATAASQLAGWALQTRPVQGTTAPKAELVFFQNIENTYTEKTKVTTDGYWGTVWIAQDTASQGSQTLTSTTFADFNTALPDWTVTVPNTRDYMLTLQTTVLSDVTGNGQNAFFQILVDSSAPSGQPNQFFQPLNASASNVSFMWKLNLTAGSHTFRVQAKIAAGSLTSSTSYYRNFFIQ